MVCTLCTLLPATLEASSLFLFHQQQVRVGGAESCRHPGDTTYDSLDWFGGVTISHSTI